MFYHRLHLLGMRGDSDEHLPQRVCYNTGNEAGGGEV